MKHWSGVALCAMLLASCADGPPEPSATAPNAQQGPELRFSGQPRADEFAQLAGQGIDVVVNLREPEEMEFDEAAAAEAAGLSYYAVPISRSGSGFDADAIAQLHAIADRHADDDVFVHCASGNRAAAWYATYLVERKGVGIDEALARARERGLRATLEPRVREYLDEGAGG